MNFGNVKEVKGTFKCDECQKTFEGHEVTLTEAADNIEIMTPMMPFVYVDKDNNLMGGREQPSKAKGDKLLACPHCESPHLFGFDPVD
ncbi:MAG: hypothetical protein R3267_04320 [Paenisporosarcina sp.]|nr:hypothetical protein [Paenisporosarcina sp.]